MYLDLSLRPETLTFALKITNTSSLVEFRSERLDCFKLPMEMTLNW